MLSIYQILFNLSYFGEDTRMTPEQASPGLSPVESVSLISSPLLWETSDEPTITWSKKKLPPPPGCPRGIGCRISVEVLCLARRLAFCDGNQYQEHLSRNSGSFNMTQT